MSRRLSTRYLSALACALVVGACSGDSAKQNEVENRNAVANGLRLSPNPAFAASRLDVTFEDRWIDPATCRFQWRRNGSVIEGASTNLLAPSYFSKGDLITVEASVEDSTTGKTRHLNASVEVANTPPKITRTTAVMTTSSGTPEVQAIVECTDADGDGLSYSYQWFKNDSPISGATDANVKPSSLMRGDRVVVEVTASDGESHSPPFRSEALEIENHPPQFSSQPVVPKASDAAFRYQATAVDPDSDPLVFELVSAPAGMTMEPQGIVVWALPSQSQRQGEHHVKIKVTDSKGGEAVQDFSLRFDSSKASKAKP